MSSAKSSSLGNQVSEGLLDLSILSWDQSGGCQLGKNINFFYDSLGPISSVIKPAFPMMQ